LPQLFRKGEQAFLARDIYESGLKFPGLLEKADGFALSAEQSTAETLYPDFIPQVAAMRLQRMAKISEALAELRKSKKIAIELKLPTENLQALDKKIASLEKLIDNE
jgi:hypothetical protein